MKNIPGTPFKISRDGEIRLVRDNVPVQQSVDADTCMNYVTDDNGTRTYIHEALMQAFPHPCGNPGGFVVGWKDGNRAMNWTPSIRWVPGLLEKGWTYRKSNKEGRPAYLVCDLICQRKGWDMLELMRIVDLDEDTIRYIQQGDWDREKTRETGFLVHGTKDVTVGATTFKRRDMSPGDKNRIQELVSEAQGAIAQREESAQKLADALTVARAQVRQGKADLAAQVEALAEEYGVSTFVIWGITGRRR